MRPSTTPMGVDTSRMGLAIFTRSSIIRQRTSAQRWNMRPVTGYLANPLTVLIRSYRAEDWPQLWPILRTTIASGDTYAFPPDSTEEEIKQLWIEAPMATHVACAEDGTLIGSY